MRISGGRHWGRASRGLPLARRPWTARATTVENLHPRAIGNGTVSPEPCHLRRTALVRVAICHEEFNVKVLMAPR
jgi:hypothetical protein